MNEFKRARREGVVKFGYDFDRVGEVTALWGAKKGAFQAAFPIPGKEDTIGLVIGEEGGVKESEEGLGAETTSWHNVPTRGMNQDSRGWQQIVRIEEYHDDPQISADRVKNELARPLMRYVFWKETWNGAVWPKFHGVFVLDRSATEASQLAGENHCFYKKIADEVECLRG